MKNGENAIADVPRLMQCWNESRNPRYLLLARAALVRACEDLMESVGKASCGITAEEQRAFDEHAAQVRAINADLAKLKADRIAEHGAGYVHVPF